MVELHVEHLLTKYLEDELDDSQAQEVKQHVARCENCCEALLWLRESNDVWDDEVTCDPGPELTDRIMQHIAYSEMKVWRPVRQPFWKRSDVRNMTASVMAAFVLWHGISSFVLKGSAVDAGMVVDEKMQGVTFQFKVMFESWVTDLSQWMKG